MSLIIRRLDPEEFYRLPSALNELSDERPPGPNAIVVAAILNGEIVGTISAEPSMVASNFYLDLAQRGTGIAERMASELEAIAPNELPKFLVTTSPHVELLALQHSFIPIRGVLWRR
jgi:hypothetical protein